MPSGCGIKDSGIKLRRIAHPRPVEGHRYTVIVSDCATQKGGRRRSPASQTNGNTNKRYPNEHQCLRVGDDGGGFFSGKNTHEHAYYRK